MAVNMVNIVPITSKLNGIAPADGWQGVTQSGQGITKTFSDMFKNAVSEIEQLDAVKRQDAYNLSIGEIDDIAQVAINAQKSDVAIQLMVQMRNKLLDSYSEIMRMNI